MNSLEIISSMKTKSRKKYYDENAIEAYKNRLKSYNSKDLKDFGGIPYDYAVINKFLQINNVNNEGTNSINLKMSKVNKKRAKNIIELVKGIDKRMVLLPHNFKKPLYKGITHISKITLDSNTPVIYKAYCSTTTDYETALNFTYDKSLKKDEYSIVLKLQLNPTIKVYDYEDYTYESEFLLERNTVISNFVFNSHDRKNGVYIYDAIVSKYNPEPLFIPKKTSPDFLGLKLSND
uniref:Uncharacterized protein n=1 Tax=viral metagenome TaxID=1070528 RepID=A0A6C0LBJ6_9ZZZZ